MMSEAKKKESFITELKQLNSLFSNRDRAKFGMLLLMMLVGSFLEVIGIGLVPVFVGVLGSPEKAMNHPTLGPILNRLGLEPGNSHVVIYSSLLLIVVFALKNAYLIVNKYIQLRVVKNRQVALARRMFSAYMHAPVEFHLRRNSAELLRNVNNETNIVSQELINNVFSICMGLMMAMSILALLVAVDPTATLVAFTALGVAGGGMLFVLQRRMRMMGRKALADRKEIIKTINQGFGSLRVLRLTAREDSAVNRLAQRAYRLAQTQTIVQIIGQSTNYYLETVAVSTLLLVCIFLIATGHSAETVAPTLALFGVALVRLKVNVAQIIGAINSMQFRLPSVAPLCRDLKRLEGIDVVKLKAKITPMKFEHDIKLIDVTYQYPEAQTPVLRDVDLTIQKGSSVAFIGQTGSGKSTLIDLILGLLPVSNGKVEVDGHDIQGNLYGWQANIGYVPQVIYLTDDTIRRNIAFGLEEDQIDEEKVWEALRAAQLENFVKELPEGINAQVGERGVCISGGQRQRIGIARALYDNPELLVLDEATSALDIETEASVIQSIEKMRGRRTILMITHRLSTTNCCDIRYLLKNGMLVETEDLAGNAATG
jgi:ATP-binding cassette, subfamily B, bacterial PglK